MTNVEVFHLTVNVTLIAAQWIWLTTYPKVVNTWSAIPDFKEGLDELTRVYAERRKRMSRGSYTVLGLVLLNCGWELWGRLSLLFNN